MTKSSKYASYQGKTVSVKEYSRQKFDILQLDAQRILGLEPAKICSGPVGTCPTITRKLPDGRFGTFLEPPAEGSDTWNYATRLIKLRWPVVVVWIGYPLVVSINEVKFISE